MKIGTTEVKGMSLSIGGNGGMQITGRAETPEKQRVAEETILKMRDAIGALLLSIGIQPRWTRSPHTDGRTYPDGWCWSPNIAKADLPRAKEAVMALCERVGIPRKP